MNEAEELIGLIEKKEKLVAMLAPSFPVVFEYPQIVTRLKHLGFSYVVEVSAGAKLTNEAVVSLLASDPKARFITSPCPSFVRMVRTKYQHLLPYLAFKADSPMAATAKIVHEKYPGSRPVFIGPCVAKKFEAKEDRPELNILVVTYKELDDIFTRFKIPNEEAVPGEAFDILEKTTRIYPTDGGLTETSGARRFLKDDEIKIVSGWKNCIAALSEFENNSKIRFMDVLFCEGGCIMGPGIKSSLSLEERKKKILEFAENNPVK